MLEAVRADLALLGVRAELHTYTVCVCAMPRNAPVHGAMYITAHPCKVPRTTPFWGIAHTHTVYVWSSALTASSARSVLAGPRDRLGHPDTAYH